MHSNRLSAFALSGTAARGWDYPEIALRNPAGGLPPAESGSSLLRALQRRLAALGRGHDRPPSSPRPLPPRIQSCDGHWEDPMLWLLVIH